MRVNSGPLLVILPCKTVIDSHFKKETSKDNDWSPWAETVIDNLIPGLRRILVEDNNHVINRKSRDDLEDVFQKLLRTLEDSWLGPWKRMLAGEWSEYDDLDEKVQEIKRMLSENKVMDVDEMSIKAAIERAQHFFNAEEYIAKLILNHECYIGDGVNEPGLDEVLKCVRKTLQKIGTSCRNLVIIVPNLNVQGYFMITFYFELYC
nr:hypothetical protein [Tanacetum cinerariifolium]